MEQFPYKSCRRRQLDEWQRVDDRDDVKAFIRRIREKAAREREASASVTSLMSVSGVGKPKKRLSDKMTLTEKENQHFEIDFALQNVLVESNLCTNAFGDGSTKVLRVPNTESRMLV